MERGKMSSMHITYQQRGCADTEKLNARVSTSAGDQLLYISKENQRSLRLMSKDARAPSSSITGLAGRLLPAKQRKGGVTKEVLFLRRPQTWFFLCMDSLLCEFL
jgi:hypothetical protein